MGKNPYSGLPKSAFWKTGVAQENPYEMKDIYEKKFEIGADTKIATAGSCFAQHISHHLKKNGYNVLDVEPPPEKLPENLHQKHGFSMYSARYGNIYTVRQLLQLAQEAAGEWTPKHYIWEKSGKFYDALRPRVEPEGLDSPEKVIEHRRYHVARVRELFESLDLFIFTLGLTEMWVHKESGTVYPTAPGALVGEFDEALFEFKNAQFNEILADFNQFQTVLNTIREGKPFKCILTVSPVPLTATASGKHVLTSTLYSKSTLRSVAGQLSINQSHIDYFPSYEIVTNPKMHSSAYSNNLRSIKDETVEIVMSHFFVQHKKLLSPIDETSQEKIDILCEEELLDLLADNDMSDVGKDSKIFVQMVGNSYGNQFVKQLKKISKETSIDFVYSFAAIDKLRDWKSIDFQIPRQISDFKEEYRDSINQISLTRVPNYLWIIGAGFLGNSILWDLGGKQDRGAIGAKQILFNDGDHITDKDLVGIFKELPLISRIDDCPTHLKNKFYNRALTVKKILDKYSSLSRDAKLKFIPEPIMSESSGRLRYGNKYVESGSQVIYNQVAENCAREVMPEYFKNGTIVMHPTGVTNERGFSPDGYTIGKGMPRERINQHPSSSYYFHSANECLKSLT